ncbi:MAG: DUF1294 domain-containing protein [Candidatus Thermoplasmatota archaeon]|nr:DUF1294 domain-containing protein [Candidatus Thermoplasmatota archaeon]
MAWLTRKGNPTSNIRQKVLWTMAILIVLGTTSFFLLFHTDLFISYMISVSIVSFLLFSLDKLQAKRGGTRIPEASLITITLLGGFIGSFLSMVIFRHKIRKTKFWVLVITALAIYSAIVYFLYIG